MSTNEIELSLRTISCRSWFTEWTWQRLRTHRWLKRLATINFARVQMPWWNPLNEAAHRMMLQMRTIEVKALTVDAINLAPRTVAEIFGLTCQAPVLSQRPKIHPSLCLERKKDNVSYVIGRKSAKDSKRRRRYAIIAARILLINASATTAASFRWSNTKRLSRLKVDKTRSMIQTVNARHAANKFLRSRGIVDPLVAARQLVRLALVTDRARHRATQAASKTTLSRVILCLTTKINMSSRLLHLSRKALLIRQIFSPPMNSWRWRRVCSPARCSRRPRRAACLDSWLVVCSSRRRRSRTSATSATSRCRDGRIYCCGAQCRPWAAPCSQNKHLWITMIQWCATSTTWCRHHSALTTNSTAEPIKQPAHTFYECVYERWLTCGLLQFWESYLIISYFFQSVLSV